MTSGITAVSASSDVTAASLPHAFPSSGHRPASTAEDSVQLSSAAQKYLNTPKVESSAGRGMVEQLVRAAAAGDMAAMALLTVA